MDELDLMGFTRIQLQEQDDVSALFSGSQSALQPASGRVCSDPLAGECWASADPTGKPGGPTRSQ